MPTLIFATYIRKGELRVYPFYEYVRATHDEYHGSELGFLGDTDYVGSSDDVAPEIGFLLLLTALRVEILPLSRYRLRIADFAALSISM